MRSRTSFLVMSGVVACPTLSTAVAADGLVWSVVFWFTSATATADSNEGGLVFEDGGIVSSPDSLSGMIVLGADILLSENKLVKKPVTEERTPAVLFSTSAPTFC